MSERLKAVHVPPAIKKRLLRIPLRLDRVAGTLRKIAQRTCDRRDMISLGPETVRELDLLFIQLTDVLDAFHDRLRSKECTGLDQPLRRSREFRHRAQDFRIALCNGWHVNFCFTKESLAYWDILDLMMHMGTSLEEAAVALLELEGGTERSAQSAHGLEPQGSRRHPRGSGHAGESSSETLEHGRPKEERVMIPNKILFCTDFSKNSEPARELAISYADSFGATLVLLHVVDAGDFQYPRFDDLVPIEETLKSLELVCDRELKAMREEIQKVLSSVRAYCVSGVPAKEIVGFAQEEGIDLIVMGTHGWTGLSRFLMGSTAENVVRTATCPVLIARSLSPPP